MTHQTTVTKSTGGTNPHNRQPTNPSPELGPAHNINAHISPAVTSTQQFRVRVSPVAERNDGVSRVLVHSFEVGDLVWGKVKSHPWWPGYICNEAFASSSARLGKKEGCVLVAFFGDGSYGWFDPVQLIPFDENFAEKSKQVKLKSFSNAVKDAVEEASRRCALGLMCRCRSFGNFRPTGVKGYFRVHVPDYDSGIYSVAQIRSAKNSFKPAETLAFIKELAVAPHGGDDRCCYFAKNKAAVFALRRAVFELHDESFELRDESNVEAVRAQPHHTYDPQANQLVQPVIYSEAHTKNEKNVFRPAETLAFIKKLAVARHCVDRKSCSFVNNKAVVFAFRQALFNQHGDTYVEALGVPPLRHCNPQSQTNPLVQPFSHPTSDYVHGIYSEAQTRKEKNGFGLAETPDSIKQLAIAPHGGDHRRCSYSKNKAVLFGLQQTMFKLHDETYDEVFEKEPLHTANPQAAQPLSYRASTPSNSPVMVEKHQGEAVEKHEDIWSTNQDGVASAKISKVAFDDKGKESSEEKTKRFEPVDAASKRSLVMALPSLIHETSHCIHLESKTSIDVKHDGNVILLVPRDGGEPMEKHEDTWSINQDGVASAKISKVAFKDKGKESLEERSKRFEPIVAASKRSLVMALPSLIHETSHCIHLESKNSIDVKHDGNVILSVPRDGVLKKINVQKRPADDLNSEFSAVGEKRRKKITSSIVEKPSTSEKSAHPSGKVDISASKFLRVCRRLLYELKGIALGPFHGVKRKIHSIVIKFFLRFRSLAYQKSLLLPPPTKNEAPEVRATKSPSDDHASASPCMKPVKHIVQTDNPSKAARKRAATDRQEEINAKRLKKMKALKASDTEKKAATQPPPKVVKPGSTGKVERPAKRFLPTELAIKFPPMASLPSVAELKTRFARFGRIHQSSLRVSSKTSTCRVVFFRKIDAQAAHKFALANQSLFGNAGVRYFLKELDLFSPNISEVAKASEDISSNKTQHIKDPAVVQQPLPQPMIHLKSILKRKSNRDVLGEGTSKRTRVKFMLAGEESSKGYRNNSNSDDGSAHSSVAVDFNTKNFQEVISQPSLPILPFHTQSAKTTQHKLHNFEMVPTNTPNFTNTGVSTSTTTVDISQQMMGLLTRCQGVVTNLTGSGYVPYRPL